MNSQYSYETNMGRGAEEEVKPSPELPSQKDDDVEPDFISDDDVDD